MSKLCANQQEIDCPSSGKIEPISQSTKARASSLLEPVMKVSLDAEPMGRECSWCWVLLKRLGKGKSQLPPIQISPVLRHVHESIFLPAKKWRNTLCFIFIPLMSPMSQLMSYWLMQNLEPSGEINTTILTVCCLRTGKSTCEKKISFSELKRCDFELRTVSFQSTCASTCENVKVPPAVAFLGFGQSERTSLSWETF